MQIATMATTAGQRSRVNVGVCLQFVAIAAIVAILYRTVIADLATEWWTEEASSYGMLVPPVALFIAYQRRRLILSHPAKTDARGLCLLAVACIVFLVGGLAAEFFLSRISFVLLLAGLTWTFWGWARFRTLLFPFILLATMVPLPAIVFTAIASPLQLFASAVATNCAQWLGVSIYRDGNIIYLANTSLGVAEACSGLNSLSSMVVASLLLGFIENLSVLGRILLFALSIPLAVFVNVVRVTGTALLADHEPAFAMGFYHTFSGWLVFVVGFGFLWLVAKLLCWTRKSPRAYV
jgi:exosortase